ncbi:MAG: nuclear transport factor 2 family protein [Chitinophagales bacterium]
MKKLTLLFMGMLFSIANLYAQTNIVAEVTLFNLNSGVDATAFQTRDAEIEKDFTSLQPGFLKRSSAVNADGQYAVLVFWETLADADASIAAFQIDPTVADYFGMIDGNTFSVERYTTLQRPDIDFALASDNVIEVTTFKINDNLDSSNFEARDAEIEADFTSLQPGFIRRASSVNADGEYAIIVFWETLADADASIAAFQIDPSVADYFGMIDGNTFAVNRYSYFNNSSNLIVPDKLSVTADVFFPEDIVIANNAVYVSGLGDGSIRSFDLTQDNPMGETFAAAEAGYGQAWGLKSDGTVLLSLLNNADFMGGDSGPAKLVEYDMASGTKTREWDLPAGTIGHTVSIVEGKYYVTDFGSPRIMEVDPSTGTVNESWFTSPDWDPTISGIGGTIYDNEGGFYVSQGNKLWYLPISGGTAGTLQEVAVAGLDAVDADGISWDDENNTLYYATNDAGDPADAGTVYKLVFSNSTTATGSVVTTGLDDSSGLWYYENDGNEYVFVLESQFGVLFGLDTYNPPFNIEVIEVNTELTNEEKAIALNEGLVTGDASVLAYVSDEQYIQHNLSIPSGKEAIAAFYTGANIGVTVDIHRSFEIGDFVVMQTTFGGAWGAISGSNSDQVVFDVWRFENGLAVEHWDNMGNVADDMDGTSQTDGAVTPATDLGSTDANQTLLEEMAQTLFVDGDWTNIRDYFDLDNYIQHSVGAGADGAFLATLEGQTGLPFYEDVKFIHTLGNFGLVMSQGPDITGQDPDGVYAYYDLFRMENGKIVEHWDVIQLIPPVEEWANPNGKWGDDAVSIENILAQNSAISVMPNPFRNTTSFEIELAKEGEFLFQVFDVSGRQVSSQSLKLNEGNNKFTFDGSHLNNGMYNYRLSNYQGFVSGKMIVLD